MSEANKTQVGGFHYKTQYEHWDMIADAGFGAGYFVGQITKYLTRWKTKEGKKDLDKALHFTNKLIELRDTGMHVPEGEIGLDEMVRYRIENSLDQLTGDLVEALIIGRESTTLEQIRDGILKLIQQCEQAPPLRSDSNKHAPFVDNDRDFNRGQE